jgi:hypothetical protein
LLLLGACTSTLVAEVPGDQPLGTFAVTASPVTRACELDDFTDAGFSLKVTLSRDTVTGSAWLTTEGGSARDASWDGQYLDSVGSAVRTFSQCSDCTTTLEEDFDVAVLSASQDLAAGSRCPDAPLDGGVPRPDADAGVLAPGPGRYAYDAVRLCGVMHARVLAVANDGGFCPGVCTACQVWYQLEGERR